MTEPWMSADAIAIARSIVAAHRRHTGRDLVHPTDDDRALAQALHAMPAFVLAHDGAADPRYIYANRAAQQLWGYTAAEFIGMPSRLSAPPDQRVRRDGMLATARTAGVIVAPDLLRVTRDGRRFVIAEVTLWNLDQDGVRGQAACGARWRFLADPT